MIFSGTSLWGTQKVQHLENRLYNRLIIPWCSTMYAVNVFTHDFSLFMSVDGTNGGKLTIIHNSNNG